METKRNGTKEEMQDRNRKIKRGIGRCFACVMLSAAFVPCVGTFALAGTTSLELASRDLAVEEDLDLVTPVAATYSPAETTATTLATTTSSSTTTTTTSSATTTTTSAVATTTTTEVAVAETEVAPDEFVDEAAREADCSTDDAGYYSVNVSDEELVMLARTLAQEGGDCSYTQQCCVIWTVLNRVVSSEWPNTVSENLLKPDQFAYYPWRDYRPDHYQTVCEAVAAWENGESLIGPDYQYFYGDGWRNHFYGKYSPEYVPD